MCRCWLGHNVATLTRPNCFGWYFFRLKRVPEIGLAVFPEAKLFSGWNFRVKNEIQNWNPEFVSHYGMPAGDHCGDLADMMLATGAGTGSPVTVRPPATATGCRPGLPDRPHGHGLRPRPATAPVTRTGHRQRTARPHGPAPARQAGHCEDVAKRRTGCGRF